MWIIILNYKSHIFSNNKLIIIMILVMLGVFITIIEKIEKLHYKEEISKMVAEIPSN